MLRCAEILLFSWVVLILGIVFIILSPLTVPAVLLFLVTKKIRKSKRETIFGYLMRRHKRKR